MDKKPLNILCLDGGGVRGLSSLLILGSLMERLKNNVGVQTDGPASQVEPKPCEVFDMICGTSTGGLIALMLGRLRMSVHDATICYLDFSRTVFEEKAPSRSFWDRFLPSNDESSAIYDASKLEEWVKNLVEKYGGDAQAPLKDPLDRRDGLCRTFVLAVSPAYADAPPKRFRTYSSSLRGADTCKIWEAARATTAAIPFFSKATFGVPSQSYIDGSFSGSNNPSRLAIDEARDIFPSRGIGCFLSLGTGVPDIISVNGGPHAVATACMKLIKSCELVHNAVGKMFVDKMGNASYFRFSVKNGLENIEIDEWNREDELAQITESYMRDHEEDEKVSICIETLKPKVIEMAVLAEEAESPQMV